MNEIFAQIIYPAWKLKYRALRRILRRSMVIEVAGNYSTSRKVRTWRILLQVIKHEFVTFQSVAYITHVETEVLYDEIGHLAPYFTTNKSNKVKGTVTNSETSRHFERLTKCRRFKYLLKELDPAAFIACDKWFHKLGPPITKEHFVCVCAREHTLACMRVSLHACVVFACIHVHICVIVCVCVCAHAFCFS